MVFKPTISCVRDRHSYRGIFKSTPIRASVINQIKKPTEHVSIWEKLECVLQPTFGFRIFITYVWTFMTVVLCCFTPVLLYKGAQKAVVMIPCNTADTPCFLQRWSTLPLKLTRKCNNNVDPFFPTYVEPKFLLPTRFKLSIFYILFYKLYYYLRWF